MPTRNISLTERQDAFIQKLVDSGEYQNASEAVREALRMLEQRRKQYALKLKALRAQIEVGIEALERGEYIELEDHELEDFMDGLVPSPKSKRSR